MDRHGQVTPAYRSDTIALDETDILSWVHFGDLHITTAAAENYGDFLALGTSSCSGGIYSSR